MMAQEQEAVTVAPLETAANGKLSEVTPIDFRSDGVVKELEELLEKARKGEIRAIAAVYEYRDGAGGWTSAFGSFAHKMAMVGRLYVLATAIANSMIDD